jgi:hypothetical protein
MRTVLLVSYTFPPQYDVSARRAAKLCKYLPAAGWKPIVLTKDWTGDVAAEDHRVYTVTSHADAVDGLRDVTVVRAPYRTHDNALRRLHRRLGGAYGDEAGANDREANLTSTAFDPNESRTPSGGVATWTPPALTRRALSLLSPTFGDFPDAFRGWSDTAARMGAEIVRRERVDAICSLCPPATAHVIASEIARRTGVPWVAQFDDLYSFHLERQRPTWRPYTDRRHRAWLRRATLAGAITPAMLRYVQQTYGLDGDVVMVGFDPDDSPAVERTPHDRLRLAYTGSVYPGDQRPEILFDALDRVIQANPGPRPPLEITFAGTGRDRQLRAMLAPFPAAERACTFIDRLAPIDALRLQREADALILLNCTRPSAEEGTLSFPAKAFEYLSAGRPILALPSDPGEWGDRLLESTRAGITADSAEAAASVLARWIAAWRATGAVPYDGDRDEIALYSQPRQAAALARLLDRAVDGGSVATIAELDRSTR